MLTMAGLSGGGEGNARDPTVIEGRGGGGMREEVTEGDGEWPELDPFLRDGKEDLFLRPAEAEVTMLLLDAVRERGPGIADP